MLSIFTPTYNRAYIITELYKSLLSQTNKEFEWLVVDDGSTDSTEDLIQSFIINNKISVRYIKQSNEGKYRAINRGAKEAKGELFFIVDSDDILSNNAVESLLFHYNNIRNDFSFAGVSGLKVTPCGLKVGGESDYTILDCNKFDFRYKYKIKGDMAEAVRTDILRLYPFPEIDGEKFCAESMIWNKIAQHYKLRYFYEKIYICDYLTDGLTANSVKLRMQSCRLAMILYSDLFKMKVPLRIKIKAATNYWRFALCSSISVRDKLKQINIISLAFFPVSMILHHKDLLR